MQYLLYNPLSGKENQAKIDADCYSVAANMSTELVDLTKIKNFGSFLASIDLYDDIVKAQTDVCKTNKNFVLVSTKAAALKKSYYQAEVNYDMATGKI